MLWTDLVPVHGDGPSCQGCNDKLRDVHPALGEWFHRMKSKYVSIHIAWGFRNEAEQEKCFRDGASVLRWPASKHNHLGLDGKPQALALDVFQIDDDGVDRWSPAFYFKLSEEIQNEYGPKFIRWGGTFKKPDKPHFELL